MSLAGTLCSYLARKSHQELSWDLDLSDTSSPFLILIYKLVLPMYDVGPIPSRSRTWLDEQGAQHCSCRSRIARC